MPDVRNLKHRLSRSVKLAAAGLVLISAAATALTPVNAQSSSTDVKVNVCYPPSAPTILTPPDGEETKNSSITMTGTATPDSFVYAVRNGTEVGFVTAAGDGSYGISVPLVVGENILMAREKNPCGNAADSADSVIVTRLYVPPPTPPTPDRPATPEDLPEPDLGRPGTPATPPTPSEPEEPDELVRRPFISVRQECVDVSEPKIIINGESASLTTVRLYRSNKQIGAVQSDEEGNFTLSAPLEPGENRLIALADQTQSKVLAVCYDDTSETEQAGLVLPVFLIGLALGFLVLPGLIAGFRNSPVSRWLLAWLTGLGNRSNRQ